MEKEFKKNDRIIWDSSWGYEIGYFEETGATVGTLKVDMITGIVQGLVSHPISEIKPYSKELVSELTKKYGYEKSFAETF